MATDLLPPPGEFKTTEEIRDAKYADELAARRKRMLLWSAPLMLIALLAAIKLLSAVAVNMAGQSAYANANHQTAADRFALLADYGNVIEPWKAHFNEGTATYAGGDFFQATEDLRVALDLVPKSPQGEPPGKDECDVRTNYSLALEGLGDEAMIASDPAMGANYYGQAQEMLANCGESGGNGGEEAQEAEERQQDSQSEAEQQEQEQQEGQGGEDSTEQPTDGESQSGDPTDGQSQSGDPTSGSSSGEGSQDPTDGSSSGEGSEDPSESQSASGGSESVDPQQEELESRNQDAQQSADAEEQASGGGDGSGQNW